MGGTYTQLFVHLVWATRGRAPLLEGVMERRVYAVIRGRCRAAGGLVLAIGGTRDHVHVLVRIPTTISIAALAKSLKGGSAYTANHHAEGPFRIRWQSGYGAFTVCRRHVAAVVEYIRNQPAIHAARRTKPALERTQPPPPPRQALPLRSAEPSSRGS